MQSQGLRLNWFLLFFTQNLFQIFNMQEESSAKPVLLEGWVEWVAAPQLMYYIAFQIIFTF